MNQWIDLEEQFGAHNYAPLPVVLTHGKGVHVWDEKGKKYIDMMSAYSAVSHGHCHPTIVKVVCEQASRLGVVSRAFYSDKLGPFLKKACELTHLDAALPMNTGAEAVETALKAARKWAYTIKKVPEHQAEIIVCRGNFHGRTIAIVGMSTEPAYRKGFDPFPPGFKTVPYGDSEALKAAISSNTAAFLLEPIQGEGGIVLPPKGYLKECEKICRENNVLLLCDEIQTGLGRTGKMLACDHDDVKPDGVMLGKALGGGMLPVSLFLSRKEIMDVFKPGDHGSTFGGNPLSSAVGLAALNIIVDEDLSENARKMGEYFLTQLHALRSPLIKDIRGKGLLIGIEIAEGYSAREICLKLLDKGMLSKDTHHTVIRLAPPLVISKEEIDQAIQIIKDVLMNM